MEFQFYGGNCVKISSKKASVVIDDTLAELGGKSITKSGDIVLFTGPHGEANKDAKIVIDQAGEYEVSDVSIQGVQAQAHLDEEKQKNAVIYKLIVDDVRIAVLGHIYPSLSGNQLEALGTIDVLIIPVGGNGYTIDPVGALKLIKDIEPKLIIPTHYEDATLNYPVPQQPLSEALKTLAMEPAQTTAKLKLKSSDLTDVAQLVVLEKQ